MMTAKRIGSSTRQQILTGLPAGPVMLAIAHVTVHPCILHPCSRLNPAQSVRSTVEASKHTGKP